jgi:hypothetical protein
MIGGMRSCIELLELWKMCIGIRKLAWNSRWIWVILYIRIFLKKNPNTVAIRICFLFASKHAINIRHENIEFYTRKKKKKPMDETEPPLSSSSSSCGSSLPPAQPNPAAGICRRPSPKATVLQWSFLPPSLIVCFSLCVSFEDEED